MGASNGGGRPSFRVDQEISLRFRGDYWYEVGDTSTFIPEGTELLGTWDADQPADEAVCALTVGEVSWRVHLAHVELRPLGYNTPLVDWQRSIAQQHHDQARQKSEQGELEQAERLYARAAVEFEASGLPATMVAHERTCRALVLLELDRAADACDLLQLCAGVCEAAMQDRRNILFGTHLDDAEQAADPLIALAVLYTSNETVQDHSLARACVARLLAINKVIKKRYETKVDILSTVTQVLYDLGDVKEALTYFEQANRFFDQQLADRTWRPEVARLKKKLTELKEDLAVGEATRRVKCMIEAATSDELEAVLAHLSAHKVPGLEITKGVTPVYRSRDPRAATVYRAHIRLTIQAG